MPAALGTALAAAGLVWALWAAYALRRAGNALRLAATPQVLVDEGPYRYSRHPMYLGLALAIAGLALALVSPWLAGLALLFIVVVARVHVPAEEQRLRQRFGGWYSDYSTSVRRWL